MPSSVTPFSQPWTRTQQSSQESLQPPIVSSRDSGWQNVVVEEFRQPPGQETYHNLTEHTLCLSLNGFPSRLSQKIGDRRHTSLFSKGDLSIAPAQTVLVSQWSQPDQYLRIRVASEFLEHIAQSELDLNGDRVELLPEFRVRHRPIEHISLMLLNELHTGGLAGHLYVESLTTALAIHLLRDYSAMQPCLALYDGGLSDHQLLQVTQYIRDCLTDSIQLSDLAKLLGLSQFHFSRLFKQSTGVPPYQYVLQQRVERAKQLLQTTTLSVMEIALLCGFSSHSHLGKWFRHYTGVTPKAFRMQ